jgi:hypothetical protein
MSMLVDAECSIHISANLHASLVGVRVSTYSFLLHDFYSPKNIFKFVESYLPLILTAPWHATLRKCSSNNSNSNSNNNNNSFVRVYGACMCMHAC